MEKLHRIDKVSKKDIEESIRDVLRKHEEISFAYLHGSFFKGEIFHDIDVAVYLKRMPASVLEYELQVETELMVGVGRYIIEVRVLNVAPLSFKYNVIKDGITLLVRDDDKRAEFQETAISAYLDFLPYHNRYLEESLGVKI